MQVYASLLNEFHQNFDRFSDRGLAGETHPRGENPDSRLASKLVRKELVKGAQVVDYSDYSSLCSICKFVSKQFLVHK